MKRFWCILCLVLYTIITTSVYNNVYAQTQTKQQHLLNEEEIKVMLEKQKDPVFAGILSLYMPGLGQFYCGEKFKGITFLVVEYGIVISSVLYFIDFNFKGGEHSGFNLKIDAKRTEVGNISSDRKNLLYVTLAGLCAIHFYNIYDAVQSAYSFNDNLEIKKRELLQKYPDIKLGINAEGGMYLGLSSHF